MKVVAIVDSCFGAARLRIARQIDHYFRWNLDSDSGEGQAVIPGRWNDPTLHDRDPDLPRSRLDGTAIGG